MWLLHLKQELITMLAELLITAHSGLKAIKGEEIMWLEV